MSAVTLTIDDRRVAAEPGESVLDAALRHGIAIPHLCTHPGLPPFGACRLCLVEVEGIKGFPASCTTPVQEGMVVRTDTEDLRLLRRSILELILLEHPSACLVCDKRELCEKYRPRADKAGCTTGCHTCNNKEVCDVRRLSADLGLADLPTAPFYRALPVETSEPFIDRDLNLCVLCGRCVRVCKARHGTATIDFLSRGSSTVVGPAFGRSLLEAGCRFCGGCVDVCPTGSLAARYGKWHGAPDAETETTCMFCGAGCGLRVLTDRRRAVDVRAVQAEVGLCVLGRFALPAFLGGADRLRRPMVRCDGAWQQADWPTALSAAAGRLQAFRGEGFVLVCDAATTLEDRFVFRRFAREVMRSPHCIEIEPDRRGVARAELPDGAKAALLTGSFVEASRLDGLELLIVQDCYPSPAGDRADFVLPAAVLAEIDGTFADETGAPRPLRKACQAPGEARPDWRIVSDLAAAMGAKGFDYASTEAVTAALEAPAAEPRDPHAPTPPAAADPRARRTHFRGHRIDEKVPGLKHLPLDEDHA